MNQEQNNIYIKVASSHLDEAPVLTAPITKEDKAFFVIVSGSQGTKVLGILTEPEVLEIAKGQHNAIAEGTRGTLAIPEGTPLEVVNADLLNTYTMIPLEGMQLQSITSQFTVEETDAPVEPETEESEAKEDDLPSEEDHEAPVDDCECDTECNS